MFRYAKGPSTGPTNSMGGRAAPAAPECALCPAPPGQMLCYRFVGPRAAPLDIFHERNSELQTAVTRCAAQRPTDTALTRHSGGRMRRMAAGHACGRPVTRRQAAEACRLRIGVAHVTSCWTAAPANWGGFCAPGRQKTLAPPARLSNRL